MKIYKPCWYGVLSEDGERERLLKVACSPMDEIIILISEEQLLNSKIKIIIRIAFEGEVKSL